MDTADCSRPRSHRSAAHDRPAWPPAPPRWRRASSPPDHRRTAAPRRNAARRPLLRAPARGGWACRSERWRGSSFDHLGLEGGLAVLDVDGELDVADVGAILPEVAFVLAQLGREAIER